MLTPLNTWDLNAERSFMPVLCHIFLKENNTIGLMIKNFRAAKDDNFINMTIFRFKCWILRQQLHSIGRYPSLSSLFRLQRICIIFMQI